MSRRSAGVKIQPVERQKMEICQNSPEGFRSSSAGPTRADLAVRISTLLWLTSPFRNPPAPTVTLTFTQTKEAHTLASLPALSCLQHSPSPADARIHSAAAG